MNARKRRPSELTVGLDPIRVGLLQEDFNGAYLRATTERDAEISRRLNVLREWYGVPPGADCWWQLCLAMARDKFPGFREKSVRKPRKWNSLTLTMLAGEMHRTVNDGATTQPKAAEILAASEPWKGFLAPGRWSRSKAYSAASNLLEQYTHMAARDRTIGEHAYLMCIRDGKLDEWKNLVADALNRPE